MGERKSLILLLVLVTLLITIPETKVSTAQSGTLVVPDDYPTIETAIGNATDGDTIFVKKGTYDGPINQTLVLNKTISFIGEDPKETVLNLHPPWVIREFIINAPVYGYDDSIETQANDVEISGFTINGQGNFVVSGDNTQINNNILNLDLWLAGSKGNVTQNIITNISVDGSRNTVSRNNVTGGRINLYFGSTHTIYGNTILNGSCIGVHTNGNNIFNNTVTNCDYGIMVWDTASNNTVYGNILTNNEIGLQVTTGGNNNTFYDNYVANNYIGVTGRTNHQIGDNNILYHNNFVDNIEQTSAPFSNYIGGVFDNEKEGNYWSNYRGTDTDGDGIGDTPYIIDENRRDNYPLMEPVTISGFQPPEITFPAVYVESPQNTSYPTKDVLLNFSWNHTITGEPVMYMGYWSWGIARYMGYWIDNEIQQGIDTFNGSNYNTTVKNLSEGIHNITVAAPSGTGFANTVTVQFTVDLTSPNVTLSIPANTTYQTDPLIQFTVDESTSWMGYSLDGQTNVTVTANTITLTELSNGSHNITVYANDAAGNTGTSQTFTFTVAKEQKEDTTSTLEDTASTLTAAVTAIAIAAVAGAALIFYTKKERKPQKAGDI